MATSYRYPAITAGNRGFPQAPARLVTRMIHIATVHWMSDRWIDLQLDHLQRNMDRPYRVYADLEGIEERHGERFDVATDLGPIPHAQTLHALADLIAAP